MLIFEQSSANRRANNLMLDMSDQQIDIPDELLRKDILKLPEVSELQVLRHYTKLSQQNYSIDTNFYPLGSCTMKYNPRIAQRLATLPQFILQHPYVNIDRIQGYLSCLYELQGYISNIVGLPAVSLAPMAGAQGEFVGIAMIRAYHTERGDTERNEILVPDAAHGTNPASAIQCGYKVKEIPTNSDGDIIIDELRKVVGPRTAGLMLTNPSTLGVFERNIQEVQKIVHNAGGLLYYDGANLNAILGRVRPGDMGFDVLHLNLHKTFATPHGGGGPGAGPVAASERLAKYLPIPFVAKKHKYYWVTKNDNPSTIGRIGATMGNANVLLRAYIYIRMLGKDGLRRVSDYAVLNANYLAKSLEKIGFTLAFPNRLATHEFIVTLKEQSKNSVTALDFAKRLLDYKIHSPTVYFPLSIPECWLIEPTETECKEELDNFINIMRKIFEEYKKEPDILKNAPHNLNVTRIDEVYAARQLDVICQE